MSDRNFKEIRKQLRTVVREILSEVLSAEMVTTTMKQVNEKIDSRLNTLADAVKDRLDNIDQRQQDVQSYILRNTTHVPAQAPDTGPTPPTASE